MASKKAIEIIAANSEIWNDMIHSKIDNRWRCLLGMEKRKKMEKFSTTLTNYEKTEQH